jgi:hypothetical protein
MRLTRRARGRLDSHRFLGLLATLSFVRFVSESRPASRRYRLLQLSSAEIKLV